MRLTHFALMLDRDELACFDRDLLPSPENVVPDIGQLVVMNLTNGPRPIEAVEYAYELVRQNFTSSRAHKAIILSVLARPKDLQLPEPEIIEVGSAVKYSDEDSGVEHWHIIEDSPNPDSSRLEFAPENSLSVAMIGKKTGDYFFIRNDEIHAKRGQIIEVWSKFKYRFNRSLEEWETHFPDDKWLWSFSFKPERKDNFDPAFRAIDKQAAFIKEREEIYANNPLSATSFAKMVGITVLQAVQHIVGSGKLPTAMQLRSPARHYSRQRPIGIAESDCFGRVGVSNASFDGAIQRITVAALHKNRIQRNHIGATQGTDGIEKSRYASDD